jgi:hypothetical protein
VVGKDAVDKDGTRLFRVQEDGNVQIGAVPVGTNGVRNLTIGSGTAPSSSPADAAALYVADQAAGNACVHIRTEGGAVIKLYQQALIADPSGGGTQDAEARTAINSILDLLENNGLMAAA